VREGRAHQFAPIPGVRDAQGRQNVCFGALRKPERQFPEAAEERQPRPELRVPAFAAEIDCSLGAAMTAANPTRSFAIYRALID
jgi:hypothetical protein